MKSKSRSKYRLLPASGIQTDDFEVTGFCLPADKVGGDYYDYFYRDNSHLDLVIADVSGHSIGPALFMVETRSALRMQSNVSVMPAEVLARLNQFLFDDLDRADYFISLFYLQVDLNRQQITYSNAGHPPPLLFNRRSNQVIELGTDGLLVGIQPNVTFEQKTMPITAGDIILFYTDGIIEAENADQTFFGLERVKTNLQQHAIESPQAIIEGLFTELRQFCQTTTFNDDITLMVFKWC